MTVAIHGVLDEAIHGGEAASAHWTGGFAPAGFFHACLDVVGHTGLARAGDVVLDFLDGVMEAVANGAWRVGFLDADADGKLVFVKCESARFEIHERAFRRDTEPPGLALDSASELFAQQGA